MILLRCNTGERVTARLRDRYLRFKEIPTQPIGDRTRILVREKKKPERKKKLGKLAQVDK